ncbi:hypothetical protein F5884DRAFT_810157 [Xylogone sp. PMI_703]|nr:hypothetical protein F5884DRAFT_810157 [Xylogone sp. PMI_703]
MVGVPRSTGCLTCIRRRVKCDEVRPSCSQCRVKGRQCEGYERRRKFVSHSGFKASNEPPGNITLLPYESAAGNYVASERSSDTAGALTNPVYWSTSTDVPSFHSPIAYHSQLLSVFIIEMSRRRAMPRDIRLFTQWLSQVPQYLGRSPALDRAVSCLNLHIAGLMSCSTNLVAESRQLYGQALLDLQRAINHKNTGFSSETLCATMMLSLYELFACTEDSSWVKHSGGAGQLIKLRGPELHKSSFDRDMFNAFKGVIVLESIATETRCFLNHPSWELSTGEVAGTSAGAEFIAVCDELIFIMARCPVLLQRKNSHIRSNFGQPNHELLQSFLNLQSSLLLWKDMLIAMNALPTLIPSKSDDTLFPFVYEYECNSIASLWCHYYAVMILINQALEELESSFKAQSTTSLLVEEVCRSVSYGTNSGFFGLFYIIFCLKVAIDVADVPYKLWIHDKLSTIAKVIPVALPEPLQQAESEVPTSSTGVLS